MRKWTLIFILFSLLTNGSSQSLLFKKNSYRKEYYKAGETITFRLKGERTKYKRQILGFQDSLIVFQDFKVNPEGISHFYVDKKTRMWYILKYKYQGVLPIIGIGVLLLDVVNTAEFRKETLVFSGSLIAAGILAKLLISKKIKIKGQRKLLIVYW